MTLHSHPKIYDAIGTDYRRLRVPDGRIAQRIRQTLVGAKTVCNVGAGAGSYEPHDLEVTAVEPSQTMIDQRITTNRVVRASAESLPFDDKTFDAAMAVLTVHHWTNAEKGLLEMKRVSRRQVIFTFDPERIESLWLVRDYLPEIVAFEQQRAVPVAKIVDTLKANAVEAVEVPSDCTDGFQGAYWKRPSEYLKPEVRAAISTLAQLPQRLVGNAMRRLANDLESGEWQRRNEELLTRDSLDLGYRLIVASQDV